MIKSWHVADYLHWHVILFNIENFDKLKINLIGSFQMFLQCFKTAIQLYWKILIIYSTLHNYVTCMKLHNVHQPSV